MWTRYLSTAITGLLLLPCSLTYPQDAQAQTAKTSKSKNAKTKTKKKRKKRQYGKKRTRRISKQKRKKRVRRKGKGQVKKKTWISNFSYGNHCGSGKVSNKPPIDVVDALCQGHDTCCKEKVVADVSVCQCHCDQTLLKGARKLQKRAKKLKLTATQRGALKTIVNVFSRFSCYCKPEKLCETAPKCRRKNGLIPVCNWGKKCRMTAIRGRGGKCAKPVCKKGKICKKFMGKTFCRKGTTCRLSKKR